MKRRNRQLSPILELFELRLLQTHSPHLHGHIVTQRFHEAPSNGSIPNNAPNQLFTPSGVPTPRESRRENYKATFVGLYTIGPGRFSTEAANFFFRGVGRTTQVQNADIQLRVVRPTNPALYSTGVLSIFDRNIDSNSVLGLDVYAEPTQLDALGRPTQMVIYSLDPNISSGAYVFGLAQGTMTIHYGPVKNPPPHFAPPARRLPGVLSQGTATVVIHAQVYGWQAVFSLRNVSYNP